MLPPIKGRAFSAERSSGIVWPRPITTRAPAAPRARSPPRTRGGPSPRRSTRSIRPSESTTGLAKGRRRRSTWELYASCPGETGRTGCRPSSRGAGRGRRCRPKDGTMLWVMVHPKGAAGARGRLRVNPRDPRPRRRPRPVDVHPRGVFGRRAVGPPPAIVPLPPRVRAAVPPPRREARRTGFLCAQRPTGSGIGTPTTFGASPAPRRRRAPPPPRADAGARPPHPPAAGLPATGGRGTGSRRVTGQLFPNGLRVPAGAGSGGRGVRAGPRVPAIAAANGARVGASVAPREERRRRVSTRRR